MKKIISTTILSAVIIIPFLFAVHVSAQSQTPPPAQYEYTVLAPLPGTTKDTGKTDLQTYLPGMFNLLIGLSAAFAVLMIVLGGFQYMSTDAVLKKQEGKERIKNAILGLFLVIGAWLILYTINPNLLTFDLNIGAVKIQPGTSTGTLSPTTTGTPMTAAQIAESNSVRTSLTTENVFAYAGPCEQGQTRGCVNLNGLPDSAKDGLVLLKTSCASCSVIITGGTEGGHATHGIGQPMVDLRPDANLNSQLGFPSPKEGDTVTKTLKMSGKPDITATFKYEVVGGNANGTSSGNHWHVIFR